MNEIELKPSRRLGLLLAGMAALALGAVVAGALPAWAKAGLGAAVVGLALHGARQTLRPLGLRVLANGCLQARDAAGDWQDIVVLGDSFVTPALIVLRYRTPEGRVHARTLLPDSADAGDLRRLRVSLRWAPRTRSDTAFPGAG